MAIVELKDVYKGYLEGGVQHAVLAGANLEVEPAEVVVLRGPSGSGKSTILNLLGALDAPDHGQVLVNGRDLARAGDRERTLFRRASIGFVFQFFNLIDGLNVEENLHLPLELTGTLNAQSAAWVTHLLQRVGLLERRLSQPDRLSGGEQQRIAVLRALVHRPQLILADEPTGNLDEVAGGEVLSLLCGLVRDSGASLVMATHSDTAAAYGDRVMELRHGRLDPV